ncbi:hypothetical protein AMTRI_Chr08g167820 [Amborella trichopoda]
MSSTLSPPLPPPNLATSPTTLSTPPLPNLATTPITLSTSPPKSSRSSSSSNNGTNFTEILPNLAVLLTSRHFFFSPGKSDSLIHDIGVVDSLSKKDRETSPTWPNILGETRTAGVATVKTHRLDLYIDFQQVGSLLMELFTLKELLSCYLRLNEEYSHKFIMGAFADLVENLVFGKWPEV